MCLNCRLTKLCKGENPPFLNAQSQSSTPTNNMSTTSLSVSANDGQLVPALEAALKEVIRIKAHGFTHQELEMCKADVLTELHMLYVEREQMESSSLISQA